MTTDPGEIYLVNLGMAAKLRPMLVISRQDDQAPRALSICAPITTSNRKSPYEISIGKPKFLKEDSFVNLQGIQAIQHHELEKMIGRLPEDKMKEIRDGLIWVFSIEKK